MDWQPYINMGIGAAFAVTGWFANQLWTAVQELKREVRDLEVKLPSDFVRKSELSEDLSRIYIMLDRIDKKLDAKADK